MGRTALLAGAIFALTAAMHAPGIRGEFLSDDEGYITDNYLLRSWSGLRKIWGDPRAMPQYYPLTFTSFWVEHHLWNNRPAGYHASNVLIHALNAALVYLLLRRLRLPGAWLGGAIFALHPVNVASVAWVAERKNVLSTAFYLASLMCYARYLHLDQSERDARSGTGYALAGLGLFCCALLSKTVTCTLPVTILLIMWWRRVRIDLRAVLGLVPMFALSLGAGAVTVWVERSSAAFELTWLQRVLIAGRAFWFYAVTLLWPFRLCMMHPRWVIDVGTWWGYLFPVSLVCVFVLAVLGSRKTGRAPLAVLLFFAATLAPVLGLVNFGYMQHSFVADHLIYLACIGPIAFLASLGTKAAQYRGKTGRNIALAVAAALIAGLGLMTWKRSGVYADRGKLWDDTIAKNPGSSMAWNGRGMFNSTKGNLEQAIADYSKAIELGSGSYLANTNRSVHYRNRGYAYYRKGQFDRAIDDYDKAIELAPRNVKSYVGRGYAYHKKGLYGKAIRDYTKAIELEPDCYRAYRARWEAHFATNRYDMGIRDLDKAIALAPKVPLNYSARGMAHSQLGNQEQAVKDFNRAVILNPTDPHSYNNRGIVYRKKGEYDKAIADFNKALQLNPRLAMAYNGRGLVYRKKGDRLSAARDFGIAISLNPRYAEAWQNRGVIRRESGSPDQAIADLDRALLLNPKLASAYYNRGLAYRDKGEYDQAATDFDRAISLNPDYLDAYIGKGAVLRRQGKTSQLINHWRSALRCRSDWPEALRNLAWTFATSEDAQFRDGPEAVVLAERAWELTGRSDPMASDALAAAYAEVGRFDKAVTTIEKALELLSPVDNPDLHAQLQIRLKLYKSERPYRERPRANVEED